MTRTSRAAYPRAVIKDRSESRSGIDARPGVMRKDGAGQHNWGSLADEREIEDAAREDATFDEENVAAEDLSASTVPTRNSPPLEDLKPEAMAPSTSNGMTAAEIEEARKFRKHAFKGTEVDLTAIARTSAALRSSPPLDDVVKRPGGDNKHTVHSADSMV